MPTVSGSVTGSDGQTATWSASWTVGSVTRFGACPTNPGGTSAAAAQTVVTKMGTGAAVRQFMTSILDWPTVPTGSLMWRSYKPATTVTDAQIDALLMAAAGHLVTFWHESDNDGLTATARAARIALMNRLYDRNVALGRPATIVPIFTGGFFADYGTQANRDLWASVKGDLIGVDMDGVHDTTAPIGISYADETAEVMDWIAAHPECDGWAIGEFGTSRQPYDATGVMRRDWMAAQVGVFLAAPIKPTVINVYDYDTSAHNGATTDYNRLNDPSPELDYWRSLVAQN